MLSVPLLKQSTDYTCGPTVLCMVLAYYGITRSEEELRDQMKVNEREGTKNEQLENEARREGLFVYAKNGGTIEEIRKYVEENIPVIVNFIEEGGEGHYAVVIDISDEHLVLNDPYYEKQKNLPISDFVANWRSEDGLHPKWFMAVSKEKLFKKSYGEKKRRHM